MLLDISQPVTPTTAGFPGDEPFSCGWTCQIAHGASVNVGRITTSPHVGTHVDAPFHYDDAGARVGGLPLEAFVGPCLVIDAVGHDALHEDLLKGADLAGHPRVLFRTRAKSDPTAFHTAFPILTQDTIQKLAEARVRLVGIDAPSVDPVDSKTLPVHHALGRAGIVNVENMVLDHAEAGRYELLAQPLAWQDVDAAPLRALLRR